MNHMNTIKIFAATALLCCLALAEPVQAATSATAGAARSHAIQRLLEQVAQQPATQTAPVTILLEADPGTVDTSMLGSHGAILRYRHNRLHEISIPRGRLGAMLDKLPAGTLARFPYLMQAVAVTSQGVALTGAGDMQALGQKGAGIAVGIIDTGFEGLSASQAAGDLPANLTLVDYTGSGTGGTTHGTDVAEIVYDMAPGASLYLAKISTEVQLAQAKNDMVAAGVKVINHSAVWFGAAFYDGSGSICDTADSAVTAGTQWVNAMGNHRYKHYLATFTDSNSDLRHEFATGQNHNTISLTAGSRVDLILNWDAYPQTTVDYDLYLYNGNPDAGGTVVATSTNKQSGKGTSWFYIPYEAITYTPTVSGTYYIVVRKLTSATSNLRFTLFSTGPDLGVRTTASSLLQPADCAGPISVGATDLADNAEYFSSEGPTTDNRQKPDVAGPDRVQTSRTTLFAGTSAASPHVAGAVALLMSQHPAYTLTQIRSLLTGTAKDVSTAGTDFRTGTGRISLDADSDGINHDTDNCRLSYNPDQLNTDGDGQGNLCDADDDNDGLTDTFEASLGTHPLLQDTDGDGLSDYAEVAYDGNAATYTIGMDLNPLTTDTDNDGLSDNADPIPLAYNFGDGDLAPRNAPNGVVDAADYAVMQQIILGNGSPASSPDLAHGDLYPPGAPDGVIDASDLMQLMKRVR
jgi:hypothetical protein